MWLPEGEIGVVVYLLSFIRSSTVRAFFFSGCLGASAFGLVDFAGAGFEAFTDWTDWSAAFSGTAKVSVG